MTPPVRLDMHAPATGAMNGARSALAFPRVEPG